MYTHTKYEVLLTPTNISITASGDQGIQWSPGMVPHIVRGFSIMTISGNGNIAASGGVNSVKLKHLSAASGSAATDIATVVLATTDVPGKVIYKDGLNVEVKPGEFIFVNIPTAFASGTLFKAMAYVEPRWERPANITAMRATT